MLGAVALAPPRQVLLWLSIAAAALAQQSGAPLSTGQLVFECVWDDSCLAREAVQGFEEQPEIDASALAAWMGRWVFNEDSRCCRAAGPAEKLHLVIGGEITPQVALLRGQVAALPSNKLPSLVPNASIQALSFSSPDDISRYLKSWEVDYAMIVREAQFYYYQQGLDVWWANQSDNQVMQPDPVHPRGLLYPRLTYLFFHHPEVLTTFNISTTQLTTWEGLLAAGETLHGQDFDGDGLPDYAFCLDLRQGCSKAVYLYAAIAATFVQTDGPAQGFHWEPSSMTQLVLQPPVVQQVSRILGRLASLAQPSATSDCSAVNALFASPTSARCAFTFDWDLVAGLLGPSQVNGTDVPDVAQPFGALLTPGSTHVYDRVSRNIVACNERICPRAQVEPTPSGLALVNRAPFSLMACPDSRPSILKPLDVQLAASKLWIPVQNIIQTWVRTRDAVVRDGLPLRCMSTGDGRNNCSDLWQQPPTVQLQDSQRWPALPTLTNRPTLKDMQRSVPAMWQAYVHPNPAPDLAVPLSTFFSSVLDELAANISRLGSSAPDKAADMQAAALDKWKQVSVKAASSEWSSNATITTAAADSTQDVNYLKEWYWRSIGYVWSPDVTATASYKGRIPTNLLVAAIVVPILCLILMLLGVLLVKRPRNRSLLFGHVKHPGVSLDTTLLITDIYNSTVLWEALPATVMDDALRLHHEILRKTAAKCDGYESALEGDSFILAFHTPAAAAKFALLAQTSLLEAPWSPELLSHPDAQEVWVQLRAAGGGTGGAGKLAPSPHQFGSNRFAGPGFHAPLADSLGLPRGLGRGRKDWSGRKRWSRGSGPGRTGDESGGRGLGRLRQWLSRGRPRPPAAPASSLSITLDTGVQQSVIDTPEACCAGVEDKQAGEAVVSGVVAPGSPAAWSKAASVKQQHRGQGPDDKVGEGLPPAPRLPASRARRASEGGQYGLVREEETGVTPLLLGDTAMFRSDRFSAGMMDDDDDDQEQQQQEEEDDVLVDQAPRKHTRLSAIMTMRRPGRMADEMPQLSRAVQGLSAGVQQSASGRHLLAAYALGDMPGGQVPGALLAPGRTMVRRSSRFQTSAPHNTSPQQPPAAPAGDSSGSSPACPAPAIKLLPPAMEEEEAGSGSGSSKAGGADMAAPIVMLQDGPQGEVVEGPTSLLGVPGHMEPMSYCSWRQRLAQFWPLTPPELLPGSASEAHPDTMACIIRGLRVRMGLHSGVLSDTDLSFNRVTQSWTYGGASIKLAKAVGDAAAGGMVLLSATTFVLLARHIGGLPGQPLPVYLGDAALDVPGLVQEGEEGEEGASRSVPLYCLVTPDYRPRLAYQEPLRGLEITQLGNLDAPTGTVTICFLYVVGAAGLVAELGATAAAALRTFQRISSQLCCEYGGFVVEATEGLCLVAFADPAACALWALACSSHMAAHTWEPLLLAHELCQEVVTLDPTTGQLSWQHRGPRLRAGMHVGGVEVHVNRRTGRMAYRGRVMNRAARIASKAQDGQVLCSAAAVAQWHPQTGSTPDPSFTSAISYPSRSASYTPAPPSTAAGPPGISEAPSVVSASRHLLRATSVGTFALKGVAEIMELFECHLDNPPLPQGSNPAA